jgi:hypothetical protein
MAMHVFSQGDLISIAQFDRDQHQNICFPQTECNSLLSLCPYIKHLSRFWALMMRRVEGSKELAAAVAINRQRKSGRRDKASAMTLSCPEM